MSLNYRSRRFSRKNENIRFFRKNSRLSSRFPNRLKESIKDEPALEELMENPNLMEQFCKEHNIDYHFTYYFAQGEKVSDDILNDMYNRVSENNNFDWSHDDGYDGYGDDDDYITALLDYDYPEMLQKLKKELEDVYDEGVDISDLREVCDEFIILDIDMEYAISHYTQGIISASLDLSKLDKNDPDVQNFIKEFLFPEYYEEGFDNIDWIVDLNFDYDSWNVPSIMKKRGWIIESKNSENPFKVILPFDALTDVTFGDFGRGGDFPVGDLSGID